MPEPIRSYSELMSRKLKRYPGNPVIPHTGKDGNWKEWQVQETCIFNDPNDASRLIMFYSGAQRPEVGKAAIGRATALVTNPFQWTDEPHNPILDGGISPLNSVSIRLDCALLLNGEYWLYSTGLSAGPKDAKGNPTYGRNSIMLARSKDGVHFEWHDQPMLTADGDERDVSQAAVLCENGKWYMYYSYRTVQGKTLPGIRLAVSDDGIHWRRTGKELLSCRPGTYDSKYYEWHQVIKLGDDYVLLSECFDGKHWSIAAAHSKSPTSGWAQSDRPIFESSGVPGAFDVHHVATPAFYDMGNGPMLFYQGGNNIKDYIYSNWDIGIDVRGLIIGPKSIVHRRRTWYQARFASQTTSNGASSDSSATFRCVTRS